MKEVIKNIINNNQVSEIFDYVISNIYKKGPVDGTDMEILSYLALYRPNEFEIYKDKILNYMGVFYKDVKRSSLNEIIFGQYKKYIRDTYNEYYTPVQADIVKNISKANCFSFSAPTSTGKSFVFRNLIERGNNDAVVVVPSRALINEYYLRLCELMPDRSINILTFIDKINTAKVRRNIFVVTPERCRDLFKQKDSFNVDLFLFDEAQLSDEESTRGLFYDSIVRRCYKAYPEAKFVFAHPFINNPEAQLLKNHLRNNVAATLYEQKNVGQMYFCVDNNNVFYHFGIDKTIMGTQKIKCSFDPIEKCIRNGGSVLFYVSKSKIYNKSFLNEYGQYIDLCEEIDEDKINYYINGLKSFTGGDTIANKDHYSQMISLLKRGIVTHHGSLPLQSRSIIEQYTRDGFCKLCFATSTLEQGINMPFDIVVIDRFEASKPLEMKNLIGRAGRSSENVKFDYGYVIVSKSNMSKFREILNNPNALDVVSLLDKQEEDNSDYSDFKNAILNDTFSDQYNLTNNDLEKFSAEESDVIIKRIIDTFYKNGKLISFDEIDNDRSEIYYTFDRLYRLYLGRDLSDGEENVLHTAVKIMLWQIYGKTFKNICWYRYSYVSRSSERKKMERLGRNTNALEAKFITGFDDLPNKKLRAYSIFEKGTKAKDVDYDRIVYDTYDYIDKLIGFKLSDIFYAAFYLYYEKTEDERALSLAKYVKYGTDNERYIWMIRYGMTFEDIELLDKHIENINEKGIVFKQSISSISEDKKQSIIRYL
ncbi:MAG: DEAD/DEAH box helicase [Bacteroidales bacterium]|nr:DEAD/DEAH box helicase [Bacteroidales bacterium]